jgi:hypothetical protein
MHNHCNYKELCCCSSHDFLFIIRFKKISFIQIFVSLHFSVVFSMKNEGGEIHDDLRAASICRHLFADNITMLSRGSIIFIRHPPSAIRHHHVSSSTKVFLRDGE